MYFTSSRNKPNGASVQNRLLKKEYSELEEGDTTMDGIDSVALEGQGEENSVSTQSDEDLIYKDQFPEEIENWQGDTSDPTFKRDEFELYGGPYSPLPISKIKEKFKKINTSRRLVMKMGLTFGKEQKLYKLERSIGNCDTSKCNK